jgi:hypothetical protein
MYAIDYFLQHQIIQKKGALQKKRGTKGEKSRGSSLYMRSECANIIRGGSQKKKKTGKTRQT